MDVPENGMSPVAHRWPFCPLSVHSSNRRSLLKGSSEEWALVKGLLSKDSLLPWISFSVSRSISVPSFLLILLLIRVRQTVAVASDCNNHLTLIPWGTHGWSKWQWDTHQDCCKKSGKPKWQSPTFLATPTYTSLFSFSIYTLPFTFYCTVNVGAVEAIQTEQRIIKKKKIDDRPRMKAAMSQSRQLISWARIEIITAQTGLCIRRWWETISRVQQKSVLSDS